jgi:hypothetical protein
VAPFAKLAIPSSGRSTSTTTARAPTSDLALGPLFDFRNPDDAARRNLARLAGGDERAAEV